MKKEIEGKKKKRKRKKKKRERERKKKGKAKEETEGMERKKLKKKKKAMRCFLYFAELVFFIFSQNWVSVVLFFRRALDCSSPTLSQHWFLIILPKNIRLYISRSNKKTKRSNENEPLSLGNCPGLPGGEIAPGHDT